MFGSNAPSSWKRQPWGDQFPCSLITLISIEPSNQRTVERAGRARTKKVAGQKPPLPHPPCSPVSEVSEVSNLPLSPLPPTGPLRRSFAS